MISDWKQDPIQSSIRGENPTFLKRMNSGIVLFGYNQFLPGYCLLIAHPEVPSLNHLDMTKRTEFLLDMSILGDAIVNSLHPLRVNYSMYGNSAEFLHAHVFPRYEWEPEEHIKEPVWTYPKSTWEEPASQWSNPKFHQLRADLVASLDEMMVLQY